jgi:beta-glucuronidase
VLRRFREHDLRDVRDLRGVWDFAFLGDVEPDEVDAAGIEFGDRMAVPGCFDATPTYAGRRGLAAYRTRVPLGQGARHRLILDGVHHWGRVFVNGKAVRDHVGGFTRFAADFEEAGGGEAEIVVLADNRFDYDRCPLHLGYFDWYQYGGIARGVELHALGGMWIERLRVVTEDLARRRVALTISYRAEGASGGTDLAVSFDGDAVLSEKVDLVEGAGELVRMLEFPGAALWSPEEPNLHLLHVRLGDDDMRERIGLRQVRVDGREILLNGGPVRPRGFARHESHPETGHGLPDQLLVADAQLLREMGANFVRGAHYPQDLRWLDLCDEMGMLVWSEGIAWQHTAKHMTDERFLEAQLAHLDEMVMWAMNRPSVIMWGTLNECASNDPECRPGYEKLLGRLREMDPTRPVTYASCHPFDDVCLDLVDVISINCYPGWYEGTLDDIGAYLDRIAAHLDSQGHADRPAMISEIGAGAVWGHRDLHGDLWSEQYQAKLLEAVLRHVLVESDRWCGVSIWQFCDTRSSDERWRMLARPRGFNNKGVVDEYRRPKMAYDVVKRHFRGGEGAG